jgi:hypothetical protein
MGTLRKNKIILEKYAALLVHSGLAFYLEIGIYCIAETNPII